MPVPAPGAAPGRLLGYRRDTPRSPRAAAAAGAAALERCPCAGPRRRAGRARLGPALLLDHRLKLALLLIEPPRRPRPDTTFSFVGISARRVCVHPLDEAKTAVQPGPLPTDHPGRRVRCHRRQDLAVGSATDQGHDRPCGEGTARAHQPGGDPTRTPWGSHLSPVLTCSGFYCRSACAVTGLLGLAQAAPHTAPWIGTARSRAAPR